MNITKFISYGFIRFINCLSISFCFIFLPFYIFNLFRGKKPRNTSWEFGRKQIYDLGIEYWEKKLNKTGCDFNNKKVLEVGSGNGQWLIALHNLGSQLVEGIEPDINILNFSKEKIKDFGKTGKINLIQASSEKIPHENNKFDYLLCLGVFMFTDFDKTLNEFKRVLKPEGKLIISFNGFGYLLMKIRLGLFYFRWREVAYAIIGIINSFSYWLFRKKFGYAVLNYNSAKRLMKKYSFYIDKCFLHNDIDNLYNEEIFLFPTNYLIVSTLSNEIK
tara:strand:+ start:5694 stop:6518 length:825 start_codon:yes stop_codon:yes gene_type:complete